MRVSFFPLIFWTQCANKDHVLQLVAVYFNALFNLKVFENVKLEKYRKYVSGMNLTN